MNKDAIASFYAQIEGNIIYVYYDIFEQEGKEFDLKAKENQINDFTDDFVIIRGFPSSYYSNL